MKENVRFFNAKFYSRNCKVKVLLVAVGLMLLQLSVAQAQTTLVSYTFPVTEAYPPTGCTNDPPVAYDGNVLWYKILYEAYITCSSPASSSSGQFGGGFVTASFPVTTGVPIVINFDYWALDDGYGTATLDIRIIEEGTALMSSINVSNTSPAAGSITYTPTFTGNATARFGTLNWIDYKSINLDNIYVIQPQLPTVTSANLGAVCSSYAELGGNVTSTGGMNVTERGIVYSTSANPTTADTKVIIGSGTGAFSQSVTGFTSGQTYYARAYAINTLGTSYGSEVSFTTSQPIATTYQTFTECEGFSVTVGTNTHSTTGVYNDNVLTASGCDSIVNTTLTIYPAPTTTQTFSECQGFSVTVGTNTYTTTGYYNDILTTIHGCDSIINTSLTIEPLPEYLETTLPVNICQGSTVTLDAKTAMFLARSSYRAKMPAITELSQKVTYEAKVSRNSNDMYIISNWPDVFSVHNEDFFGNPYLQFSVTGFSGIYPIMPDSNWVHVAFVFDGTGATDADVLKVYYDGVEQIATSFTGTAPTSLTFSGISRLCDGQNTKIQNARIWNIARTQAEISSTMNTPLVGNEPGLIANYVFKEDLAYTIAGTQYLPTNTSFNYPLELYGDSTKYWPNNSYAWSDGVTNGVSFTPTVSHDYVVTITDVNTTCSTTDTTHVVISSPAPVITHSALTFCYGSGVTLSTGTYASYSWYADNSGFIYDYGITPSITIDYREYDLFVSVIDEYGCAGTSQAFTETLNRLDNKPVSISIADVVSLNVATGGTASASDTYSSNTPGGAFDGDIVIGGWGSTGNGFPSWVEYDLGTGNSQAINAYAIYVNNNQDGGWGSSYSATEWTFEGWNGTAWDILDTKTGQTLIMDTINLFPITNTNLHQKYRIVFTASEDGDYCFLTELQLLQNIVPSCTDKVFSATTTGIDLAYQWYLNGIASGTDSSVFNSSTLNLNDTVSCILTSTYKCATNSPATSNTVLVEGSGISPIITGALSYCEGSTTTIDAGVYSTYLWSNGETTQTINAIADTYSVFVTEGLCNGTSANVVVTENALPVVNLGANDTLCSNYGDIAVLDAGNAGMSYLWSDNSTAQTLTVNSTSMTSGVYNYSVTVNDGVCSSSDVITLTVDICSGVTEIDNFNNISVYPNPTNGNVSINFVDISVEQINIQDVTGKVLISKADCKSGDSFDLSRFASGVYYIQLISNKNSEITKIIKQ